MGRGIGHVCIRGLSNFVVLVGAGTNPIAPMNELVFWDDVSRSVRTTINFRSNIEWIDLVYEYLIVHSGESVFIYKWEHGTVPGPETVTLQDMMINVYKVYFAGKEMMLTNVFNALGTVRVRFYLLAQEVLINAHQSELTLAVGAPSSGGWWITTSSIAHRGRIKLFKMITKSKRVENIGTYKMSIPQPFGMRVATSAYFSEHGRFLILVSEDTRELVLLEMSLESRMPIYLLTLTLPLGIFKSRRRHMRKRNVTRIRVSALEDKEALALDIIVFAGEFSYLRYSVPIHDHSIYDAFDIESKVLYTVYHKKSRSMLNALLSKNQQQ
jgi:hypothetical protein